jgi:hypothetical protein
MKVFLRFLSLGCVTLAMGCGGSEDNKTPKVTGGTPIDLNAQPEGRGVPGGSAGPSKGAPAGGGSNTAAGINKN